VDLQRFLNSYSICEKHYNQIISTNYFYQQLLDDSHIDCNKRRRRIDTNTDDTNLLSLPLLLTTAKRVMAVIDIARLERKSVLENETLEDC